MSQTTNINKTGVATERNKISVREIVYKYLGYLPLFILSLVICVGTALMLIRYKVPIYKAIVQVLVNNPGSNNAVQQDLISQAVSGVRAINLENEMQQIKTAVLLERVVRKGNLNIQYTRIGKIKSFDAYKASPFEFIPLNIVDSTKQYSIEIKNLSNTGVEIELSKNKLKPFKWGDSIALKGFSFKLTKLSNIVSETEEDKDPYTITWKPYYAAAKDFQRSLSTGTLSAKTSVLTLNLIGENKKKNEDFLNLLVKEIIINDIEKKKESSLKTIEFIEGRLNLVYKELSDYEGQIRDYKVANRFFDVNGEYGYLQTRLTSAESIVFGLELDIKAIDFIDDYLRNNRSIGKSKIIPSNYSVSDMSFNSMLLQYNNLQTQLEKIALYTPKENNQYVELVEQLKNVKASILEAGAGLKQSKKLIIATYASRTDVDMEKLATLPDKERMLQDINRQKQVKEKLYLFLLQKREETAIASVSTESNFKEMEGAVSIPTPIEPKEQQIKSFAFILGLLIPVAFIYLVDVLNDKVTTKNDIIAKTDIPVLGEISHVDNSDIIVVENSRNIVAEQFRILRSNLQFVLSQQAVEKKCQTFLVTSTISGEGKSFISLNLASVLALTGKKVALLEFDLRKLKGINIKEIEDNNDRGITNFLIGQTDQINEIYKTISKHPTLHVYNTGPVPPNPAELIIGNRMEHFFELLKANYDYIVIDSAPVGLVSDSFALTKYADAVMYIIRQRYTFKKQLDFINDLKKDGKLTNMAIVVNDVNLTGRYGYYGYGYGYGYGYMYKYGQGGYGYGRYIYGGKKKDPYFDTNNKGYFDGVKKNNWWKRLFG